MVLYVGAGDVKTKSCKRVGVSESMTNVLIVSESSASISRHGVEFPQNINVFGS
jgi:hypothetical protein